MRRLRIGRNMALHSHAAPQPSDLIQVIEAERIETKPAVPITGPNTEVTEDVADDLDDDDEVESLPDDEQQRDEMFGVPIKRVFNQVVRHGSVDRIDLCTSTSRRLYHVLYDDGVTEHLTRKEAVDGWCATL